MSVPCTALALVAALLLAGCSDPRPTVDAGPDADTDTDTPNDADTPPPDGDSDSGPGLGQIILELTADDSVDNDDMVEAVTLSISEVRLRNDRGGELEPVLEDLDEVELSADGTALVSDDASPATYGSVSLVLAPLDGAPALRLALFDEHEESRIVVTVDTLTTPRIDVRCESPMLLEPFEQRQMSLELDVGELFDPLASELPEGEDDLQIDRLTHPTLIAALEAALPEAWELSCDEEVEESSSEE